jgi:hypothetical protein
MGLVWGELERKMERKGREVTGGALSIVVDRGIVSDRVISCGYAGVKKPCPRKH